MIGPVFSALPRPVHRPRVRVAGLHLWGAHFACRRLRSLRPRRLLCGLLALIRFAGVTSQARGDAGLLERVSYRSCSLLDREKVAMAANQIMEEALKVISAYQQARGEDCTRSARRGARVPRFAGVRRFCTKRPGLGLAGKSAFLAAPALSAERSAVMSGFASHRRFGECGRLGLRFLAAPGGQRRVYGAVVVGRGCSETRPRSASCRISRRTSRPRSCAAPFFPFFPLGLAQVGLQNYEEVQAGPVLPCAQLPSSRLRQRWQNAQSPFGHRQNKTGLVLHGSQATGPRKWRRRNRRLLALPLFPLKSPLPLFRRGRSSGAIGGCWTRECPTRSGKPFLPAEPEEDSEKLVS